MNKQIRSKAIAAGATIFWLIVWQIAAAVVNRGLLIPIPTPVSTAAALIRIMTDTESLTAVGLSVLRILAGFVCALIAGTILAVLSARFTLFRVLTAPLVQLIRAIPVASFTILLFLWVSRGKLPSTIAFFTVLPVVWANVESGITAADRDLIEMARVFGMSGAKILREIILPGIRPYFASAVSSGIGFAWKSGVAAEVICRTQQSLGNLLWAGKSSIDYDEVFAVTLLIVLLSVLIQKAAMRMFRAGTREAAGRSGAAAGRSGAAGNGVDRKAETAESTENGVVAGRHEREKEVSHDRI
jgi:NitT/TauT family transport system permease protein